MPHISEFHTTLSGSSARVREAEALIGALIEELEDVENDFSSARKRAGNRITKQPPSDDLERRLTNLLKQLKGNSKTHRPKIWSALLINEGLRPADATPLVLLDRSDILAELQSSMMRDQATQRNTVGLTAAITEQLSDL